MRIEAANREGEFTLGGKWCDEHVEEPENMRFLAFVATSLSKDPRIWNYASKPEDISARILFPRTSHEVPADARPTTEATRPVVREKEDDLPGVRRPRKVPMTLRYAESHHAQATFDKTQQKIIVVVFRR